MRSLKEAAMAPMAIRMAAWIGCFAGLLAAPSHADTIYSCAGPDGKEVLQNMPCGTGAQVWAQKDAPAAGTGRQAGDNAPAPSAQAPEPQDAQPAGDPVTPYLPTAISNDAADKDQDKDKDGGEPANLPGEPAIGMTQAQVRAMLGEPTSVQQEEVVNGRLVTWNYGDSRTVQFDVTGKVSSR
jgi:hypothetical protein